jgi:hypothetical protein
MQDNSFQEGKDTVDLEHHINDSIYDDSNEEEEDDYASEENESYASDDDDYEDINGDDFQNANERDIRHTSRLTEVEVALTVVHSPGNPYHSQSQSGALGARVTPTPRGYHTATAVRICQQDYLVMWGGLGNRIVVTPGEGGGDEQVEYQGSMTLTHLECLDCSTLDWHSSLRQSGREPAPRFGHSCTFHPRTNSLIVMGGSDGTDVLRNGVELREASERIITNISFTVI